MWIMKTKELSSNKDKLSACLHSGSSVKFYNVWKYHNLKNLLNSHVKGYTEKALES